MTTPDRPPYDERAALADYVLRCHGYLATDRESEGLRAIGMEEKARAVAEEDEGRAVQSRWQWRRLLQSPAAAEALAVGADEFRRRVCDRILADHPEIVINRCPRCRAVARTPRAAQCLWCGNDWHGTRPPPGVEADRPTT